MMVTLVLAPKVQGAAPGAPFATVDMPERPLPQEVFVLDGTAYQVLGRAMTIRHTPPCGHQVEYSLLVAQVGTVVEKDKRPSSLLITR